MLIAGIVRASQAPYLRWILVPGQRVPEVLDDLLAEAGEVVVRHERLTECGNDHESGSGKWQTGSQVTGRDDVSGRWACVIRAQMRGVALIRRGLRGEDG
jgi:hypothetical protein